ncbi:MAG: hypothetical protein AABY16_03325 [Nanoarchaeota archaeon]
MVWECREVKRDFPDSAKDELLVGFRKFIDDECDFIGSHFTGHERLITQVMFVDYRQRAILIEETVSSSGDYNPWRPLPNSLTVRVHYDDSARVYGEELGAKIDAQLSRLEKEIKCKTVA